MEFLFIDFVTHIFLSKHFGFFEIFESMIFYKIRHVLRASDIELYRGKRIGSYAKVNRLFSSNRNID